MKSYALRILGALAVSAVLLGSLFLYLGRFATYQHAVDMASGMRGFVDAFESRKVVTESELIAYSQTEVPPEYAYIEVSLGFLNGTEVIAENFCTEECVGVVRVIRLEVPAARTCSQVGGVERAVDPVIPTARFCFPKFLVDDWDKYLRANSRYSWQ